MPSTTLLKRSDFECPSVIGAQSVLVPEGFTHATSGRSCEGREGGPLNFTMTAELDCHRHPTRWTPHDLGSKLALGCTNLNSLALRGTSVTGSGSHRRGTAFSSTLSLSRGPAYRPYVDRLDAPMFEGSTDPLDLAHWAHVHDVVFNDAGTLALLDPSRLDEVSLHEWTSYP